jgi:hypothetical protein
MPQEPSTIASAAASPSPQQASAAPGAINIQALSEGGGNTVAADSLEPHPQRPGASRLTITVAGDTACRRRRFVTVQFVNTAG